MGSRISLLKVLLSGLTLLTLAACGGGGGGGGGGTDGVKLLPSTLATTVAIPPGSTCPTGGQEIFYGIDDNANGVLDESERDGSVTICNGVGGLAMLVAISEEPAGDQCPYGGDKVDAGLDNGDGAGTAADGTLQSGEIDHTYWICGYGSGLGDGTAIASLSLAVGQVHHARVAAGGFSYYQWTAPASPVAMASLIGLARTDSDLGWTLYSDAFITEVVSCDNQWGVDEDEFCLTPPLTGGATYYLAVTEQSGIPNLFDLSLNAPVLTAADPQGRIFRIDPALGTASLLSQTGITDLNAMAYLPQLGVMRAGTGWNSAQCANGCIYEVNPFTGETLQIANWDTTFVNGFMDMSVDPDGGQLYGMESTECDTLHQIDPATGVTTWWEGNVGGICTNNGLAITFDGSGLLYLSSDLGILGTNYQLWYTIPSAGPSWGWNSLGLLNFVGFGGAAPTRLLSMTVNPADGAAYGIALDDTTSVPMHFLVAVELRDVDLNGTLDVTYLATLPSRLDGLAYVGGGRSAYPPIADLSALTGLAAIDLSWREYPAADSFTIYSVAGFGNIDPANAASYDAAATGITNNVYSDPVCGDGYHTYLIAAVIGTAEVAYSSRQANGLAPACP